MPTETTTKAATGKSETLATTQPAGVSSDATATTKPVEEGHEKNLMKAETFSGLKLRGIGPALMSGRISDLAVDPRHPKRIFVAAASGGVWKSDNAGTTWSPIFEDQDSYSIGCVELDPTNPLVVWVGTGEENSQRSVSYGDGIYKSVDGGKSWKNMGLRHSEHISRILVDPVAPDTVFAAVQGPLWKPGGERGLYKTTDGGKTWRRVLEIDEYTGVTDVVMDPGNSDILIAAAYQRERRVWSFIDGGPGSGLYKSTDGGESWQKLKRGLPSKEMGKIGLAISETNPEVVYAIIEAAGDAGGFYRSTDGGWSWTKRSGKTTDYPFYYQEIVADPHDPNRVYLLDTLLQVTRDGGKTFQSINGTSKHVDNHALWVDPGEPQHLLSGCDGGLYESHDGGETWRFFDNLPITQFYRVAVDNSRPFYKIYGGTQDNATLGGPSRTTSRQGITNADWYVTVGGDGFKPQVDPAEPSIVYSQWQYGGLVRYDHQSGERIGIRPEELPATEPLRWNWNSPLLISPHSGKRLYFAANKLFRSDDRGSSWKAVSSDLTRQLDKNRLELMGRIWSVDAVGKHDGTSFYGTIVALDESPLVEGLVYVGTDDGLLQITEDGGEHWRKVESIPGIPELSYVSALLASRHDPNTVYAAFDHHKSGDFKPYILLSRDRGTSWKPIVGGLPERGSVHALAEDHVRQGLLFSGTEFGLYFSVDDGEQWVRLKGGLPTIAVRDLAVQREANALVLATFGRGFYILDDYSPLRLVTPELLEQEASLFLVPNAPMYIPRSRLGGHGKASQGDSFFAAPNPSFGAIFTYYLKETPLSDRDKRHKAEKKAVKEAREIQLPTWDELRREERQEKPATILTVRNESGSVVRRITAPATAGFHRVAWDLRYPSSKPVSLEIPKRPHWGAPRGPMAVPGTYTVSMALRLDGKLKKIGQPRTFETVPVGAAILPAWDPDAVLAFRKRTARLQRAVFGASKAAREAATHLDHIDKALFETPGATEAMRSRAIEIRSRLEDLIIELDGDPIRARYNAPAPRSISQRIQEIVRGQWSSSAEPTATHKLSYELASDAFSKNLPKLRQLIEKDLRALERELEEAGAPWTPGRLPAWQKEE